MTNSDNDAWASDDNSHPIPSLSHLDVLVHAKDGRATLGVVIATPMQFDERSQRRLLRKIHNYLGFINSDEFKAEGGTPSSVKTKIVISINANSDSLVFELIEKCKPWVLDNNAHLELKVDPLQ